MPQLTLEQVLQLALSHHQSGRLGEAEQLYRQVLTHQPAHADALHLLGLIAHQTGRNDVAADLLRRAIAARPNYAEAHCNLGNVLKELGQLDESIAACRQAIALKPHSAEAHNNLGNALKEKGQLDEAVAACRKAIVLKPNLAESHNNLGNALKEQGHLDEAIAACRQAIALKPNLPGAYSNLASVLKKQGKLDEAIAAYRQAVALKTNWPAAYTDLGNTLKDKGQTEEAIAAYRQAIALKSTYPETYNNLGNLLQDKGHLDDAIATYRQAIGLNPNLAEIHSNLGNAQRYKGQLDEAIVAYQRAIALHPDYAQAYCNLGNALKDKEQLDEAITAYQRAIVLDPHLSEVHSNLGSALKDQGRLDEALLAFRKAIALNPNYAEAHSNLAYTLHFHPDFDAHAIYQEHRLWNQRYAEPLRESIQPHSNNRNPDGPLRIGYVSPDFRYHPVGQFLLPLLSHHDKTHFEIFAYAQVARPDVMTARLRSFTDQWRNIVGLSDAQAADLIRQDSIDILVDLTMHMGNSRLLLFARKPAPVQVTYLAYTSTTGLDAIDYRLSDSYLDPPGMDESVYSEKTFRLPDSFWCYDPLSGRDIPVNTLPALETGVITFGCLNNFCKVTSSTLETWAALLGRVPCSRLLLYSPLGSHRDAIQRLMQERGIALDRLEFISRRPATDYFRTHHRIDIGLDPFPYTGGTTTCDALWMGVPAITLAGRAAVGRAGLSILSNAGLPELIAHTPEDYIQIAADLAGDLSHLSNLRATLRERMLNSPLMNAPTFTLNIEAAYRSMWKTWCDNQ